MRQKQELSGKEKVEIVRAHPNGKISQSEAARQCGVDKKTVAAWVRNYEFGSFAAADVPNPRLPQRRSAVFLCENLILFHCPLDRVRFSF